MPRSHHARLGAPLRSPRLVPAGPRLSAGAARWLVLLVGLGLGCSGRIGGEPPRAETPDGGRRPVDPPAVGGPDAGSAPSPSACATADARPPSVIVARLTRTEYIRTVRDLFGVDISAEAADLPYEVRAPFSTTAVAQATDISHVEVFSAVSRKVAEALGDFAGDYAECTRFESRCERSLVERLGERVFRRPLRSPEVDRFVALFRVVEAESDAFATGARLVLRSMLQSPQFLYHLEDRRGTVVRPVDPYALARRIAYLVWQSAPDDALVAAAAGGQLETTEHIETQVRRLAADPRAREASLSFFEDWVDLSRLERAVRELDDATKAEMRAETERFVEEVLWSDQGGLIDLLGADYTFATPELAARYDIASAGGGWQRYDLSEVPARRGILTQGSLLAAHANGNRPAFVSRGLFLLRAILCRDVPDPAAGVDTNVTDLPESASEREKSAERMGRGSCGPCHEVFDPLAYAFEGYSGTGVLSDVDRYGNAVRSDGWVPAKFGVPPGTPDGERYAYGNVDELIDILVRAPFVRSCMAEKPLGFALRRELDEVLRDECAVEAIAETTEALGGSYVDLLVAIATHPFFTLTAVDGGAQ